MRPESRLDSSNLICLYKQNIFIKGQHPHTRKHEAVTSEVAASCLYAGEAFRCFAKAVQCSAGIRRVNSSHVETVPYVKFVCIELSDSSVVFNYMWKA